MQTVGYKLVSDSNVILETWGGVWGQCPQVPSLIKCPNGDFVHAPELNVVYGGCQLVCWDMDEPEAAPVAEPTIEELGVKLSNLQASVAEISGQIAALQNGAA
jgi:hypothetical protein